MALSTPTRPADLGPATPLDRPPIPASALDLLQRASDELRRGYFAATAGERYVAGHVSALRAAAAVIAVRGRPHKRGSMPSSVWSLLPKVAPELQEWAALFEASAARRAAIESGRDTVVSVREADDQLRSVEAFHRQVAQVIGVPDPEPMPALLPACAVTRRRGDRAETTALAS